MKQQFTRRHLLSLTATGLALASTKRTFATPALLEIPSRLMNRALAALALHKGDLKYKDRIGIVDFASASRTPRFFVVDMIGGQIKGHLVAHGRGSDPAHTGWVKHLSNTPGSYASSAGAYATGEIYMGAHGRSMRLQGLDTENDNAYARAIVIHAAWYVSPEMVRTTDKLGRSEGCLAVCDSSLDEILASLGPGRMIYADKI
jgi:L,D-transpeptidase catalytic domain